MAQDIRTVMTPDPVTVDADAALVDAARLMRDNDIGHVVVTDDGEVAEPLPAGGADPQRTGR
jgi:CBS domain-containing protein